MATLREIREANGVKANAVANHLGVTRPTYKKYEDNPSIMSIAQAKAVCEFLHIPLDQIFLISKVN